MYYLTHISQVTDNQKENKKMPTTDSNPLSAIILFRYLNIGKYRETIGEVSVMYRELFLAIWCVV